MMGVKYDIFSHTSDHFDYIMEMCTKMICDQKAYVDDTEKEKMKQDREDRKESIHRSNSKLLVQI